MKVEKAAQALGWFSIGLGMLEASAPGRLAEWLGMGGHSRLVRLYGLREIANGVGLLTQSAARAGAVAVGARRR